jgi:hypothetical protein
MKRILIKLSAVLLVAGYFFSCKPDEKDPEPTPTDPKQRFIGSWTCNEHSVTDGTNSSYTMHIVDSSGGSYVIIESFYNQGFNRKAKATISGDNMSITANYNVNGLLIKNFYGHMDNSSTITMRYTMDDGTSLDSCTANVVKQ